MYHAAVLTVSDRVSRGERPDEGGPLVAELLKKGNRDPGVLGFTDHSAAHTTLVAERAAYILRKLGYSEREQELAKIAGLLHDIGNSVNRTHHAEYGALLAWDILRDKPLTLVERVTVISAIGNHDESTGGAKDPVSAALVLADKTDVRRNRVREKEREKFDIHDRVNYSVKKSQLKINEDRTLVKLKLTVDTKYGSVMDYFEIFMQRMLLCRKAAEELGLHFKFMINEQQLV